MFTYEESISTLIYMGAFTLLMYATFGMAHAGVMAHRKQNARNKRDLLEHEEKKTEGYWRRRLAQECKDYNTYFRF